MNANQDYWVQDLCARPTPAGPAQVWCDVIGIPMARGYMEAAKALQAYRDKFPAVSYRLITRVDVELVPANVKIGGVAR